MLLIIKNRKSIRSIKVVDKNKQIDLFCISFGFKKDQSDLVSYSSTLIKVLVRFLISYP
jgi:hypothetical protein